MSKRQSGSRSQHRGMVFGRNGVVVAASPLAVTTGLRVLSNGGSATDAALAAGFVTCVALPDQCGVGGDAFILSYDAHTKKISAVVGAGPSPLGLSVAMLRERHLDQMPLDGRYSIAVPGAVGAYHRAWETFGRLPWQQLWEPAIRYANDGITVGEITAEHIIKEREKISRDDGLRELFMPGGNALEVGDVLRQPQLAGTLESIAETEGESFYQGEMAGRILLALQRKGVMFEGPEWTDYQADLGEAISTTYRDYKVFTTPLPSQGFLLLEALNLIESFPMDAYGYMNPRAIHLMAEAIHTGFADRISKMGVDKLDVLVEILSKDYARRKVAEFGVDRTTRLGSRKKFSGDTTFVVATDPEGNVTCLVHSLGHSFGSGLMVEDAGIILNNRAGRGFYLDPGPNQLRPGARTMHTLMAWMVTDREGSLVWAGGTPGGDGQPQWNLQLLVHLLDWHLNPQEAVEAPRWTLFPGADSDVIGKPVELRIESRMPPGTMESLTHFHYPILALDAWGGGGGAQLVGRTPQGGWVAGSDPRVDGAAGAL